MPANENYKSSKKEEILSDLIKKKPDINDGNTDQSKASDSNEIKASEVLGLIEEFINLLYRIFIVFPINVMKLLLMILVPIAIITFLVAKFGHIVF